MILKDRVVNMAQITNRLTPFFENITFDRDDNEVVLKFGPQHPSAHGQLRLMLHLLLLQMKH